MEIYPDGTLRKIVHGYSRRISSSIPADVLLVIALFYDNLFLMWNKELFGGDDVEFIGNRTRNKGRSWRSIVCDYTISSAACEQFSMSIKMHKIGGLIGFIPKDFPKKKDLYNTDITSRLYGVNKMSVQVTKSSIYRYGTNTVDFRPSGLPKDIQIGDVVTVALDFKTRTVTFSHGDCSIITHKSIPVDQIYSPAMSLASGHDVECVAYSAK